MSLHRKLITEWFSDYWYSFFLSALPPTPPTPLQPRFAGRARGLAADSGFIPANAEHLWAHAGQTRGSASRLGAGCGCFCLSGLSVVSYFKLFGLRYIFIPIKTHLYIHSNPANAKCAIQICWAFFYYYFPFSSYPWLPNQLPNSSYQIQVIYCIAGGHMLWLIWNVPPPWFICYWS